MNKIKMAVNMGGLTMKNPVTTASGTFGSGLEMREYVDLNALGAITIKGTTLEPRHGVLPPRIIECAGGIIASVGLENPGVDVVIKDIIPKVAVYDTPIIANMAGNTVKDYGEVARILNDCPEVNALEINISCPNVKRGGMLFGTDPDSTYAAVSAVRKNTVKPVIAKLAPNVTDIVAMAKIAKNAGADALTLANAVAAMAIDIKTKKPALGNIQGGLCGPAIKPIVIRMVYQVSQAVDLPIIAAGGIVTWEDAIEYILAGATGVAVGTGNFLDPNATMKIITGIENYLRDNHYDDVNEIIGLAWK